jgi:hypothetical protein
MTAGSGIGEPEVLDLKERIARRGHGVGKRSTGSPGPTRILAQLAPARRGTGRVRAEGVWEHSERVGCWQDADSIFSSPSAPISGGSRAWSIGQLVRLGSHTLGILTALTLVQTIKTADRHPRTAGHEKRAARACRPARPMAIFPASDMRESP